MNSRCYPEFEKPIRVHEKHYPLVWYTLNGITHLPHLRQTQVGKQKLFVVNCDFSDLV